jgi:hypothetical protein
LTLHYSFNILLLEAKFTDDVCSRSCPNTPPLAPLAQLTPNESFEPSSAVDNTHRLNADETFERVVEKSSSGIIDNCEAEVTIFNCTITNFEKNVVELFIFVKRLITEMQTDDVNNIVSDKFGASDLKWLADIGWGLGSTLLRPGKFVFHSEKTCSESKSYAYDTNDNTYDEDDIHRLRAVSCLLEVTSDLYQYVQAESSVRILNRCSCLILESGSRLDWDSIVSRIRQNDNDESMTKRIVTVDSCGEKGDGDYPDQLENLEQVCRNGAAIVDLLRVHSGTKIDIIINR